jgi:hypothetical protein
MMLTMTKTSRRILCLCLPITSVAFLVYCTSPTARASIQKPTVASVPVPRKVIQSALVDLHHDETTRNDKWLTLGAIRKLLYTRFDFDAGIDFTVRELKKAANKVGPLGSKISQGNHTGIQHLHVKYTQMSHTTFILLSSSKDTQPEEPTERKAWMQALELSEAIVESVSQPLQMLPRLLLK